MTRGYFDRSSDEEVDSDLVSAIHLKLVVNMRFNLLL